ncbi:MAG: riboflavin synthase [Candidatus Omnitrophica bacterium]|nr:riboflavin synthase [Candidatus Omnitrophota bacterium]
MFTGIIGNQAVLKKRQKLPRQIRLMFEIIGKSSPFRLGESVALDGVCLTVRAFRGKQFSADVIPETLRSTTLGKLRVGQRVNMERSLRLGDRLGGHWVTGHVDGVGFIKKIERRDENFRLQIGAPTDIIRPLVSKGSIAIDGISFTIQEVQNRHFVVGVTPHTYRVTTLQWKRSGDSVNLEVDFFAKLVERFLKNGQSTFLREKGLHKQGF